MNLTYNWGLLEKHLSFYLFALMVQCLFFSMYDIFVYVVLGFLWSQLFFFYYNFLERLSRQWILYHNYLFYKYSDHALYCCTHWRKYVTKSNNRTISGQVAHSTFNRKEPFHLIWSTNNNSSGRNKTAVIWELFCSL